MNSLNTYVYRVTIYRRVANAKCRKCAHWSSCEELCENGKTRGNLCGGRRLQRLIFASAQSAHTTRRAQNNDLQQKTLRIAWQMLPKPRPSAPAWHRRNGTTQSDDLEQLDELVPNYLKEVPVNPSNGRPLTYEKRQDGYRLIGLAPHASETEMLVPWTLNDFE